MFGYYDALLSSSFFFWIMGLSEAIVTLAKAVCTKLCRKVAVVGDSSDCNKSIKLLVLLYIDELRSHH